MTKNHLEQEKLIITIDVKELNSNQIRLLKTINSLITHVMSTEDETEYFNGGQELMKLIANVIKTANFNNLEGLDSSIAYGQQALEFSIDSLVDLVQSGKFLNYDN